VQVPEHDLERAQLVIDAARAAGSSAAVEAEAQGEADALSDALSRNE